jgi:hypothetical protein
VKPTEPTHRTLTRLLLGELPEPERERLEERLLTDAAVYEALTAAEEELIDAYVAGELPPRSRETVAAALARLPGGGARLAFARGLRAVADETPASRPAERVAGAGWGWWRLPQLRWAGVAALAVLAVLAGSGLWMERRAGELSRQLDRVAARAETLAAERGALERRRAALEAELAAERARAGPQPSAERTAELAGQRQRIVALEAELAAARREAAAASAGPPTVSFLLAAAVRSAGTPELKVPADARTVSLELDLGAEETFDTYSAELTAPDGGAWTRTGIAPPGNTPATAVTLDLPAALLPPGRHEIRLYGGAPDPELLAVYELQVVRP